MKRAVAVLSLVLSVLAASSALAQSDLGLKQLGIAAGYVSPENLDGTGSFGVFADHGTITPNVHLESHADYWSWSKNSLGVESKVNDVAVGLRTKYNFEVKNSKISPYAGVGVGMHFFHSEATIPAGGGFPAETVSDSRTKLGVDLGGGLSTAVSPRADLMGELWYGVVTDVSQFSMRVAMSFKLGNQPTSSSRKVR
jgi:outer membrane protein W